MKRTLVVVLVMIMCLGVFTSCKNEEGDEFAGAKETKADVKVVNEQENQIKLGFNNVLKGIYSVDILEKAFVNACEAYGVDYMTVNDEGKVENMVTNIDNMITAGVDGIVFLGIADTLFPVLAEKCQAANVPFVLVDRIGSDEVMEIVEQGDMYVGGACSNDKSIGANLGEYAAAEGMKKAIIITGEVTDPGHSNRTYGFRDAFENGGGEVLDIGWGEVTLSKALTRADDLLTAHPDVDCIYASNGDCGVAASEALAKHSGVEAEIYVTDLDPDVLTALEKGVVSAANGGHWINGYFATALMMNYLNGNPILDDIGNPAVVEVPVMTLPNNLIELYDEFWIKSMPYSPEELRTFVAPFNIDVTLNDFNTAMQEYTAVNRLKAKVEEGLLSQETLDEALANK